MTVESIRKDLQLKLSPRRYAHTEGVAKAAKALALLYGVNPEKAELAGLLHDCAKEMPLSKMQELSKELGLLITPEVFKNGALLHGPLGAALAYHVYGVEDGDILEAIRVHTTGKVGMKALDKILFLADYIEETRDFPGVEELRALSLISLDKAVLAGYDTTISFLLSQKQSIYFKTILGRNDMLRVINSSQQ